MPDRCYDVSHWDIEANNQTESLNCFETVAIGFENSPQVTTYRSVDGGAAAAADSLKVMNMNVDRFSQWSIDQLQA